MIRTVLSGLRTFIGVPLFFIYTLILAGIIIVYGAFRPASRIHDKIVRHWASVFLKIPPVSVEVDGVDKIDPTKRYVIASNHLSQFDIPLMFSVLPLHGRFLSKKEVFKIPLVGRAMRTIGIIEIDRASGTSSRQAINEGVKVAADRGYSLIVFPEGTRGTNGDLLPFKKGAFRIAIDTGLPLVPVIIEGTELINSPGSKVFRPGTARVVIGDPIETSGMTNKDDLNDFVRTVEATITEKYQELRKA
ncbi:MAG: lysophospholipid acyltransferase family protein [Actinomycetota bacterium]